MNLSALSLIAVVSDVHGNRPALDAVLADSREHGATEVWCLGDVVGYGSEPAACLMLLREQCRAFLRGNHEQAVLDGPHGFNPMAAAAIRWTKEHLLTAPGADGRPGELLEYLGTLPVRSEQQAAVLVHGSPAQPLDEYLFQEDALDQAPRMLDYSPKLVRCFELINRPCFIGHTHVPGVIAADLTWISPADCDGRFDTRGEPCLINVGSVGQPRDGDVRASYALFDGRTVSFRRVPYDVAAAARAIRATPGLPAVLAQRLEEGW